MKNTRCSTKITSTAVPNQTSMIRSKIHSFFKQPLFIQTPGFTFLETLLVVAAMGILASIVVVAVNPAKQLGDTRNAARQVDVITLVSAVYQYSIDSEGKIPASIPVGTGCGAGEKQEICKIGGAACGKKVNLYDYIVSSTARFLIGIPSDPTVTTGTGTGYEIYRDALTNRVVVCAPRAEQKATISAAR